MSLSSIARTKLSSSSTLHRWVLLKNSIVASTPDDPPFLFPINYHPDPRASEALWLDTLLESLAHDDDDEPDVDVDPDGPPIDDDDDDDDILSPMSSSDDLSQPQHAYYPPSPAPSLPPLAFPFSNLDVLDDIDDDDTDPLKCSSCSSSSSSTSPSSSASSLPPSTPPSSPLRSWASVPKMPLAATPTPSTPPKPHIYIDAYSDPLPFSRNFTYDIQSPFVFHHS